MVQKMCWLRKSGANAEIILYLQTVSTEPWQIYTAFPQYAVPDFREPGGSKGWATYQKLIKAGWSLVSSAQAQEFAIADTDAKVVKS